MTDVDDWGAALLEQEKREGVVHNAEPSVSSVSSYAPTPVRANAARFGTRSGNVFNPQQQNGQSAYTWRAPPTAEDKPKSPEEVSALNDFLLRKLNVLREGNAENKNLQHDPTSPLYSQKTFADFGLSEPLLRALNCLGFHRPTQIQERALPILLQDKPRNLIAQSQSGTGKTAAFVVTMLSRVVVENEWPQCICIAPTIELVKQIGGVVRSMAQFMPQLRVHYAIRGIPVAYGEILKDQIVIGTTGRIIDYMTKQRVIDPAKIICIVLDEADQMLTMQGFMDHSIRICNTIKEASPSVQTMLFSATYDQPVIDFANTIINDPELVTLRKHELTRNNIKQYYVECKNKEAKYEAVVNLYSGLVIASAIIFCGTKPSADWLVEMMRAKGHEVVSLHGGMDLSLRAQTIGEFITGRYKVLVTTDVCSRGIDIPQVSVVINYDLPLHFETLQPNYETYLHRIGRTGRFGKSGIAINFIDSPETLKIIQQIEEHFEKKIEKLDPSNIEELEAVEKD